MILSKRKLKLKSSTHFEIIQSEQKKYIMHKTHLLCSLSSIISSFFRFFYYKYDVKIYLVQKRKKKHKEKIWKNKGSKSNGNSSWIACYISNNSWKTHYAIYLSRVERGNFSVYVHFFFDFSREKTKQLSFWMKS